MNTYRLFGLRLDSDLEFPELPAASPHGEAAVVSLALTSVRPPRADPGDEVAGSGFFRLADGAAWFDWPDVAAVRIADGCSIELQPDDRVDPAGLRAAILGPVFSILLVQRGLYPFHASSVVINDVAVAFAAESGGGKTTLALALKERGHAFLSDDVTAIDCDADPILAWPAYPQLKLTPKVIAHRGDDQDQMPFANPLKDKHVHRLGDGIRAASVPLDRVYLLEAPAEGSEDSIEVSGPLDSSEAFFETMRNGHRQPLLEQVVGPAELMRRCSAIAGRIPFYRLRRGRSLDRLDEFVRVIEEHAKA